MRPGILAIWSVGDSQNFGSMTLPVAVRTPGPLQWKSARITKLISFHYFIFILLEENTFNKSRMQDKSLNSSKV